MPRTNGGDNSIQDFGAEASTAGRAAAGRVLAAYLRANANGDVASACALLAPEVTRSRERTLGQAAAQGQGREAPRGCAQILAGMSARIPEQTKRQLTVARVLSFRTQGDRAFLIYDAADGEAYAIPMARASGSWLVAALGGTALLL